MLKETIEGFRLSPQQKHLWLLQKGGGQFSACCMVAITGSFDTHIFQQALDVVIQRHEVLHTVFRQIVGADIPLQIVAETDQHLWSWDESDLSTLPLLEQEQRLAALKQEILRNPLNLEYGPMISVTLVRQASTSQRLFLCLPALCVDASGLRNIVDQLVQTYRAIRDNIALTDDPDLLQYIDFAQWQSDLLAADEFALEREYWSEKKKVFQSGMSLPFMRKYTTWPPFRPAYIDLADTGDLLIRLEKVFAGEEMRYQAFFLTCWLVLLQRVCRQSDVALGVAQTNRKAQEFNEAMGLYAKYLPLSGLSGEEVPFSALMQHVQAELQNLYNLQEYFDWEPLRDVGEDTSNEPFFPCCFDWHQESIRTSTGEEPVFLFLEQDTYIDRFHVQLSCLRRASGIQLRLHYDTSTCDREDICVLAELYQTLVQAALDNLEAPIGELTYLSAQASRRILTEFSGSADHEFASGCIHHVFEEQARRTPQQVAVVVEGNSLTYGELDQRANQLAALLQTLGVQPEVRVGLFMERSCNLIVGLLGILKAGGAYVPLDPALPQERVLYILQDSQASLVVTQQALNERCVQMPGLKLVNIDSLPAEIASFAYSCSAVQPSNLAYSIYTSGSTGYPKGVAITHASLFAYVHNMIRLLALPEGASYATASTIAADLGHTAIFPALCGGSLHLLLPDTANDPEALAAYIQQHPLDCLKIVPSHLGSLLVASHSERLLQARWLILGGEATSWEMARQIHALAPHCRLLNHYGPTETTVGVLTYQVPGEKLRQSDARGFQGLPLGRPLGGTQAYVLDQQMRPVPIWAVGEIYIGGPGLARGYLGRADLTAERFVPHPFSQQPGARLYRTGDLGCWQADGTLAFAGRQDQQVKVRGYRIELGEIEAVLQRPPGVQAAVVQARTDEESGQKRLVAYLVARNAHTLDTDALREYTRLHLPEYMLPAAFVQLDALPLMPNGKLDRRALPAPEADQRLLSSARVAPQNEVQQHLAQIWQQVLGVEQVGITDNFFALGGDSILSIQIVARAGQVGLRLTPKLVFQAQTIVDLARLVERQREVVREPARGQAPLTPIQHRFFAQDRQHPEHYNQARLLRWGGALDVGLLEEVLTGLGEQHESLRLRFEQQAHGWQQWYCDEENIVLHEVDLSGLPVWERSAVLELAAAQVQSSLDLGKGPVWRAVLFILGEQEAPRLLLVLHHLVTDGVSWRILLEDLRQGYEQRERGEALVWPVRSSSYQQWGQALQAYASSAALRAQLPYWQQVNQGAVGQVLVLGEQDTIAQRNMVVSTRSVQVHLEREETRALLQEVPGVYHTHINEVLLTALGLSLAVWTGERRWRIALEGHGREPEVIGGDLDISRTMGWFTSLYPLIVDIEESGDLGRVLKEVKEQVRQVPQAGLGYGVLRYLVDHEELAEGEPEIRFNYLGQVDGTFEAAAQHWEMAQEAVGPTQHNSGTRPYLIDISAIVAEGQLQMSWGYSEALQTWEQIEQVAQQFVRQLRAIIAHCQRTQVGGFTPSDFPLAQLTQDNLDDIADLLEQIDQEGL